MSDTITAAVDALNAKMRDGFDGRINDQGYTKATLHLGTLWTCVPSVCYCLVSPGLFSEANSALSRLQCGVSSVVH